MFLQIGWILFSSHCVLPISLEKSDCLAMANTNTNTRCPVNTGSDKSCINGSFAWYNYGYGLGFQILDSMF